MQLLMFFILSACLWQAYSLCYVLSVLHLDHSEWLPAFEMKPLSDFCYIHLMTVLLVCLIKTPLFRSFNSHKGHLKWLDSRFVLISFFEQIFFLFFFFDPCRSYKYYRNVHEPKRIYKQQGSSGDEPDEPALFRPKKALWLLAQGCAAV